MKSSIMMQEVIHEGSLNDPAGGHKPWSSCCWCVGPFLISPPQHAPWMWLFPSFQLYAQVLPVLVGSDFILQPEGEGDEYNMSTLERSDHRPTLFMLSPSSPLLNGAQCIFNPTPAAPENVLIFQFPVPSNNTVALRLRSY